jgi:hypothetical protein
MRSFLRKLGIAFACGAVFCAGAVVAQNITGSLQQAQDGRGIVGIDSNGNLYFGKAHLLFGATAPPTLGTCTGGTVTAGSSDFNGQVTGGSAATCAVVFGQAFLTAPRCVATSTTNQTVGITAESLTGFTITATTTIGGFNWFCGSVS